MSDSKIRMMPGDLYAAMRGVLSERERQHAKWGEQNHPDGTGSIVAIGNATLARESCEGAFARGEGTYLHILLEEVAEAFAESDPVKLRAELVQVAAVAVAWIETIDRRNGEIECRGHPCDGTQCPPCAAVRSQDAGEVAPTAPPPTGDCTKPPLPGGWNCSLPAGHSGDCAEVPFA